MLTKKRCPVCDSIFVVFMHDVIGNRTGNKIPQYYCMDCHSFFNFSGYVEDEKQKKADFEYLLPLQDHISRNQAQLLLEILDRAPGIKTVCEVGSGTGLFLKNCHYYRLDAVGFEVNPFASQYARDVIEVDCRDEILTADHEGRYDLIAAIGVFEHLENPRGLFRTLTQLLNPNGCIYLNVPFVERKHWRFLHNASVAVPEGPPDPFYDNDVHIIHFSIEGLMTMGRQLGARACEYFVSKDVVEAAPGAYPGVLFRF